MKFSTRGRYALRAMIMLAEHYGEGPLTIRVISENQEISLKYLEAIMRTFATSGLVISAKGKSGGFILSRHPKEITMADILKVSEGTLSPVACLDNPDICSLKENCKSMKMWRDLREITVNYLESITLEAIAGQEMPGKSLKEIPGK